MFFGHGHIMQAYPLMSRNRSIWQWLIVKPRTSALMVAIARIDRSLIATVAQFIS